MSLCRISIALFTLCTLSAVANADTPDPAALQQMVLDSADRYIKAFQAHDAKAIAALFTPEAEFIVSDGTVFHGRDAIQAEFTAAFSLSTPGTTEVELISIRPIADGALTEEGISTFIPKDEGPTTRTRYTATHVKQGDGTWLLASVRELDAVEMTPHDRLKSLSWLVGKWHEDSDGSIVSTEWKWAEEGNFLLSKFAVKGIRGLSIDGEHRIGWDAEKKQFHSWVFDSKGGHSEGLWTQEEDESWSVRLSGIDADGVRLAGRLNYSTDGANALVITEDQRSRSGIGLPEFTRRVVRQPPSPELVATDAAAAKAPAAKPGTPSPDAAKPPVSKPIGTKPQSMK